MRCWTQPLRDEPDPHRRFAGIQQFFLQVSFTLVFYVTREQRFISDAHRVCSSGLNRPCCLVKCLPEFQGASFWACECPLPSRHSACPPAARCARSCACVQLAVPSRQDVAEYQNLRATVNELVAPINGHFGTVEFMPIHFMH